VLFFQALRTKAGAIVLEALIMQLELVARLRAIPGSRGSAGRLREMEACRDIRILRMSIKR